MSDTISNVTLTMNVNGRSRTVTCEPRKLLSDVLREDLVEEFQKSNEADFAHSIAGVGRFRVNAFRQRGSVSIVMRAIPYSIRSVTELATGIDMPESPMHALRATLEAALLRIAGDADASDVRPRVVVFDESVERVLLLVEPLTLHLGLRPEVVVEVGRIVDERVGIADRPDHRINHQWIAVDVVLGEHQAAAATVARTQRVCGDGEDLVAHKLRGRVVRRLVKQDVAERRAKLQAALKRLAEIG